MQRITMEYRQRQNDSTVIRSQTAQKWHCRPTPATMVGNGLNLGSKFLALISSILAPKIWPLIVWTTSKYFVGSPTEIHPPESFFFILYFYKHVCKKRRRVCSCKISHRSIYRNKGCGPPNLYTPYFITCLGIYAHIIRSAYFNPAFVKAATH